MTRVTFSEIVANLTCVVFLIVVVTFLIVVVTFALYWIWTVTA